ncbi:MAG TPA: MBL fold metallo-hydrolase [Vicinamibacterales bacterium]|nr:MBL fold metallo-hydrolase [Vicinamibacterales bacterium]
MQFGEFELTPLLDGRFRLDGGAMFGVVPKPLWNRRAPADDRNRISLAMRPLLVRRTGAAPMIIDAGVGAKMDAKSVDIYAIDRSTNLESTLREAGLTTSDIGTVLASHLHFDHAGGFTTLTESATVVPAFANARYLINLGEWNDATHPHERNRASYFVENYVPLHDARVVDFTDDNAGIVDGIRVQRTGGHTRYHQIVYIESDGRTAVFAADLIPTTAHVDVPWIMGYDLYPMETLEFKRAFVREAIDREYLIFFEHDPQIAAGYIREKDGRRVVERVL